MKITPLEVADWLENPTTRKVLELFHKRREGLKEILTTERDHAESIRTAGVCEGYRDLLSVDYEYFSEEYELNEVNTKEEVDNE